MRAHQTIPFPEITGDNTRDIANLHEYVFKLQEGLLFTLQNLDLKNVSRSALGECEIRKLDDGGVWIGSKKEMTNGIVIYADKAPVKYADGEPESF